MRLTPSTPTIQPHAENGVPCMRLGRNKKLVQPFRLETAGKGQQTSNRLHVRDRISGQMFLVDTGADISLVPADHRIKDRLAVLKLFAANNTRIDTFGESLRELDLGVRRQIRWYFCIAAVPYAIIGADLLSLRINGRFKEIASRR